MAEIPTCPKCDGRLIARQTRRDRYGKLSYRVRICDKCEHKLTEYAESGIDDVDRLKQKDIHIRPVGPGMLRLIEEALSYQGE